jgi:hypothetical protein
MHLATRSRQIICCLVTILLFAARTADAHVHLCALALQCNAGLHLADGGIHSCASDGDSSHSKDKDVRIVADGLLKKADFADQSFIPPASVSIEFALVSTFGLVRIPAPDFLTVAPTYLRPPLRGPPL